MNKELEQYIKSIEEDIKSYKEGRLYTQEYLQTIEELDQWLKEQKDENSSN